MTKRIGSYQRVRAEGGGRGVVSQAGAVLLVETVRKSGLDSAMSAALAPWRKARAVHDPGKILLDVALAVALGGDCLADFEVLRAEPGVFGPVASAPTVSRLVARPRWEARADRDPPGSCPGPRACLGPGRGRGSRPGRTGDRGPGRDAGIAHSDEQDAAATWKRTFGHHPIMGFVDHGAGGAGEPVAGLLSLFFIYQDLPGLPMALRVSGRLTVLPTA
ncbi:transposase [Streptomyces sp. NPDC021218]|uniref:transposase n=1 Tax=Streptomyces sp. NPDC021218 TaxID=3365119 RepID=UPI0037AAB472